jgi:hypothetical protein
MIISKHFSFWPGADDADTQARVQAIGDTCERDLAILQDWFGCNFDDSPYGIIVFVGPGKHLGGASNFGYVTNESSQIEINGTYAPPNGAPNPALRDEYARMIFVAELAEILMDFSFKGWNRGNSMGEGLSILAAETLHPAGYYATGSGPRIGAWLKGGRPDFVSQNEATDVNSVSYGCALLFLNYLRYQLSFSFQQIVAAAGPFQGLFGVLGGVSPGMVFSQLTGRPAATAYKEFTDLLQAHIPSFQPFTPVSDNIFPLRNAKQRSVEFSAAEIELNAVAEPKALLIKAQAGPMCEPNIYSYHNVDVSSKLTLTSRVFGFARPQFAWSVNGVALNNSAAPQNITVTHNAVDTVPGRGEKALSVNLTLNCVLSVVGSIGTLTIFNASSPGNGPLTVSLSATEALVATDTPTSFTDTPWIVTRRYNMAGAWYRDVSACNIKDLGLVHQTVKSLAALVVADEGRPNINPATTRALAVAATRYVQALDDLTNGSRGLDRDAAEILRQSSSVHAAFEPQFLPGVAGGLPMRRNVVQSPADHPRDTHGEPQATEPTGSV